MENLTEDSVCVSKQPHAKVTYLEMPVISKSDKKEYRVIQLENGLIALLISDLHSLPSEDNSVDGKEAASSEKSGKEYNADDNQSDYKKNCKSSACSKRLERDEKMAACALSVNVGSFSDPPEIPGLAHFLEHMVFMGSEKYTQENDFDAFIRNRGGWSNAWTSSELTTFYFNIQEKYLLSALDRFTQFFIKPLMKKDAITREREAVESEFQMALSSDDCRIAQLFCSFARLNHPATKFSWGNLITLQDNVADEKLYEELHKFRERHYSAHRMKLAIQARLSLDELEDYVTQCFASVPSNDLPPDDFTLFKGVDSFNTPSFRRIYKIKPINDICEVELTWTMPPAYDLYRSKPFHYIGWIMGHEGKGSLISYLRKKMWCLEISSGVGLCNSMYTLFSSSLSLTERGHKHLPEVLDCIFSFINLMLREGPQKRIYDEMYQIKETSFRFMKEILPVEYVQVLCPNMHYFASRDYIIGDDLYFEYNPEAIEAWMKYLSPDNVNIIILDKKFNDEEFDKVEPWFNTKYTDMEIPQEWIDRWKTIEPSSEFHLPLPNVFLTDDFSLIPIPADVSKYPTEIYLDEHTEVWYRPDPKFRLPECYMYFRIVCPTAGCLLKGAVLMDLYVAILVQLLKEALYPATCAELNNLIYSEGKGIVVEVSGYNQKLPLLLMTIAKCIADSPTLITEELFEIMKKEQMRNYYNSFVKPEGLIGEVEWSILTLVHWMSTDKHAAITNVGFNEFLNFVRHFCDHVYIQCLVQGNMTKGDVIKHVQECVKTLNCGPLLPNTMSQLRAMQIPIGSSYCKVRNFNTTDVNSVVLNYYQSGVNSVRLLVIMELLMMIMDETLFNQLRTQEQLGYDISCSVEGIVGSLGYSITVYTQANKYSTEYVDKRIEAFLEMFNDFLKKTSVKDLENFKEAVIKLKQCADIYLQEEVDRNWSKISCGTYTFDSIEKELCMIEHITIEELREWMKCHTMNGSNLRKLSVHVVGSDESTDKETNKLVESQVYGTTSNAKVEKNEDVKYALTYVPAPEKSDDTSVHITDIQRYKCGLYGYPAEQACSQGRPVTSFSVPPLTSVVRDRRSLLKNNATSRRITHAWFGCMFRATKIEKEKLFLLRGKVYADLP